MSYQTWLEGARLRMHQEAAHLAKARNLRETAIDEAILGAEASSRDSPLRDQELIHQQLPDLFKQGNPLIVIVRGAMHYRMIDLLRGKNIRAFFALDSSLDPAAMGPESAVSARMRANPSTPASALDRQLFEYYERYADAIHRYYGSTREPTLEGEAAAALEESRRAGAREMFQALRAEMPVVRPFIQLMDASGAVTEILGHGSDPTRLNRSEVLWRLPNELKLIGHVLAGGLEEISHLIGHYGLREGLRRAWENPGAIWRGELDVTDSRHPVRGALAGIAASLSAGGLMMNRVPWLGFAIIARVLLDASLLPWTPDHELRIALRHGAAKFRRPPILDSSFAPLRLAAS